jgi:hypothetical protein
VQKPLRALKDLEAGASSLTGIPLTTTQVHKPMTDFNPDTFMTEEQSGTLETSFTPIPEDEYTAIIKDVTAGSTPNGAPKLDVQWLIDSEEVREFTGMDEPSCKQTIWLDLDDNGKLAMGANKNVGLGKLRDALGQNDGSPWSPAMLIGQPARVLIKHNPSGRGDGNVYANVVQVAAA